MIRKTPNKRQSKKRQSVLTKQSIRRKRKKRSSAAFVLIRHMVSGLLRVFVMFMILAMTSLLFLSAYHYLLASPYLKLEHVVVNGVDEKIRQELIQMCGLSTDLGLLAINIHQLERKMSTHPWVRSVNVKRSFPHTLVVDIKKELPYALVLMDKTYYMNQYGEVFKEVSDGDEMDYPVITGVSEQGQGLRQELATAVHVMGVLEFEDEPWSLNDLSEIHVNRYGGMSLYFSGLQAKISLMRHLSVIPITRDRGEGDIGRKLNRLRKVAHHLRRVGRIQQVTGIDLNYVDEAVVSFGKG